MMRAMTRGIERSIINELSVQILREYPGIVSYLETIFREIRRIMIKVVKNMISIIFNAFRLHFIMLRPTVCAYIMQSVKSSVYRAISSTVKDLMTKLIPNLKG